jgi:excisionase family DNA binding protein
VDLEAAAKVLGVHYQTAYRWVRMGLLPAVKVGSGYELRPEDVEGLAEERRNREPARPDPSIDWVKEGDRLYEALMSGQDLAAEALVEELVETGVRAVDLCDRLFGPVLRRAGDDPSLSNGQVAMAAEISERVLGALAAPSRGRPRGLVVVVSPEGERHRLPGLMATVALRGDRWRVHHLGADVGEDDLVAFVAETEPDVVVLSLASGEGPTSDTVDRLRSRIRARVLIGGPGESAEALLRAAGGSRSPYDRD